MLYVKLSEELLELTDKEEPLEKQLLFDILEISFTELSWFNKQVLQCYLELGSLKKVSNEMKIPITTIGKYVLDSKNEIKKNVNKLWPDPVDDIDPVTDKDPDTIELFCAINPLRAINSFGIIY